MFWDSFATSTELPAWHWKPNKTLHLLSEPIICISPLARAGSRASRSTWDQRSSVERWPPTLTLTSTSRPALLFRCHPSSYCPSWWSLFLSSAFCVDHHHSNRVTGTAMLILHPHNDHLTRARTGITSSTPSGSWSTSSASSSPSTRSLYDGSIS